MRSKRRRPRWRLGIVELAVEFFVDGLEAAVGGEFSLVEGPAVDDDFFFEWFGDALEPGAAGQDYGMSYTFQGRCSVCP